MALVQQQEIQERDLRRQIELQVRRFVGVAAFSPGTRPAWTSPKAPEYPTSGG